MGWRNKKARSALGSALKHADSLAMILAELNAICASTELEKEAAWFDDWTMSVTALVADLVQTWQDWYGDLPAELEDRPVVQLLKAAMEVE